MNPPQEPRELPPSPTALASPLHHTGTDTHVLENFMPLVRPSDTRPSDTRPSDTRPSDSRPTKSKGLKKVLLEGGSKALETVPPTIPPAAQAFMASNTLPFKINPIKVANVMATAYFTRAGIGQDELPFDLVRLTTSLRNSEYMPKQGRNKGFPATILRMAVLNTSHMTSFAIFEKGVVNLNGGLRSAADALLAVKRITQLLRKLYPDLVLVSWSITNVYANVHLPVAVRLDRFASLPFDMRRQDPPLPDDHPLCQVVPTLLIDFNPEVFSGAKIWFEPRKGVWTKRGRNKGRYATLFANGHMNLTGNKSVAEAWLSYLTIVRILIHAPYLWKPLSKRTASLSDESTDDPRKKPKLNS